MNKNHVHSTENKNDSLPMKHGILVHYSFKMLIKPISSDFLNRSRNWY